MYDVYNTGLKWVTGGGGNFTDKNKGLLLTNTNGSFTKYQEIYLFSNPTGGERGDMFKVAIPPETTIVVPMRVHSMGSATGKGTGDVIMLF